MDAAPSVLPCSLADCDGFPAAGASLLFLLKRVFPVDAVPADRNLAAIIHCSVLFGGV